MSQQSVASGRKAEGHSGGWYCCRKLATFSPKSFARGIQSGSALILPMIFREQTHSEGFHSLLNSQSAFEAFLAPLYLAYDDSKGEDVHTFVIAFSWKPILKIWKIISIAAFLRSIKSKCDEWRRFTDHKASLGPSSRGFPRQCSASSGQACGAQTVSPAGPQRTSGCDSSPPSPAEPAQNPPPPQTGSRS